MPDLVTVPLTWRERRMLGMLKLAVAYLRKGIAEHAYDGCVMSGETALTRLTRFIEAAERGEPMEG